MKNKILIFLVLVCILNSSGLSEESDLDFVLEKMFNQIEKLEKEVKDIIFSAEIKYKHRKRRWKREGNITMKSRVYVKGTDKYYKEILSINVDGKELNYEEMKRVLKEIEKWEENGINGDRHGALSSQHFKDNYNFHLFGERTWNNIQVWKVGFQYKKAEEIVGFICISKEDYNIVYIESERIPDDMDDKIERLEMCATYSMVKGYSFLKEFELRMKLGYSSLKQVKFECSFSDFKINNELDDEFFELREKPFGLEPFSTLQEKIGE